MIENLKNQLAVHWKQHYRIQELRHDSSNDNGSLPSGTIRPEYDIRPKYDIVGHLGQISTTGMPVLFQLQRNQERK